jgi:hypothetical protein
MAGVLGHHDYVERGAVLDQERSVAVEDQSSRGVDALQADSIVLGKHPVILALDHLELPQAKDQEHGGDADDSERDAESPPEPDRYFTLTRQFHGKTLLGPPD